MYSSLKNLLLLLVSVFFIASCSNQTPKAKDRTIEYSKMDWFQSYLFTGSNRESDVFSFPMIVFREDTVDLYQEIEGKIQLVYALEIIGCTTDDIRNDGASCIAKLNGEGINFTKSGEQRISVTVQDKELQLPIIHAYKMDEEK